MEDQQKARRQFEVMWWMFTLALLAGVLAPILVSLESYPFLIPNAVFIVATMVFIRWLFLLRYSWFARNLWIKLILMFLCFPILFYLLDQLGQFRSYLDEYGLQDLMGDLSFEESNRLISFIRFEMLLFGISSILGVVLLGFRMLISIWRVHNRKTV